MDTPTPTPTPSPSPTPTKDATPKPKADPNPGNPRPNPGRPMRDPQPPTPPERGHRDHPARDPQPGHPVPMPPQRKEPDPTPMSAGDVTGRSSLDVPPPYRGEEPGRPGRRDAPLQIYRCMVCGQKFESEEELAEHRSQGHERKL